MYDDTRRDPTATLDVFEQGKTPPRAYKKIATLSFLGPPEDDGKAMRHFVKDGKKIGANAVMYLGPDAGHTRGRGGWGSGGGGFRFGTVHIFKADAVVYE